MRLKLVLLILVFSGLNTLAQVPVITSFSPASGPVGSTVTIVGNNFNTTPSANVVYFGAAKATVTSATKSQLTVTVPSGADYRPISALNTATALTGYAQIPFVTTFAGAHKISTSEFDPYVRFASGIIPTSAILTDLDQDGKPDLVVGNTNSSSIAIYSNTSVKGTIDSNSFAGKIDISVGQLFPVAVVAGDLDGDGKPDLVVSYEGYNGMVFGVFRNTSTTGNISFAAAVNYTLTGQPSSLTIADIDGDGKPDLVALTTNSSKINTLTVFKNTSTPGVITGNSFANSVDIIANTSATALTVGDMDSDGKPDIILLSTSGNTISLLRNISATGTISFAAKVDFATSVTPIGIAIGDLDGDGKPDLAVSNTVTGTISVYLNKSQSGNFTASSLAPKVDFATSNSPTLLNIADMDGDGKPDILAVNGSEGSISMFHNRATTGVINATSFDVKIDMPAQDAKQVPALLDSFCLGDIDGDGKPDMIVVTDYVAVYHNNPQFVPVITGISPASAQVGATVSIAGKNFNTTAASNIVYFGPVKAKVSSASATQLNVTVPAGASFGPISVLNSDSKLTGYSATAFIPTFASKHSISSLDFDPKADLPVSGQVSGISFSDVDGDGKPDMVVANLNKGYFYASVYRNISTSGSIGTSSFAPNADFITKGAPGPIILEDINGDGKPDMMVLNKNNGTVSYLQNQCVPGTIAFGPLVDVGGASYPVDLNTTDLDGDGRPDLLVISPETYSTTALQITHNISSGGKIAFDRSIIYDTGKQHQAICVGDIDGDGRPDVILGNTDNTLSILQNNSVNGNIILAAAIDIPAASGSVAFIKLTDINGDGKPDLVVGYHEANNTQSNVISVFRNISTTGTISASSFAAKVDIATGTSSGEAIIADMDGDGKPDIVVTDAVISVLLNNSTGSNITFSSKTDLLSGITTTLNLYSPEYINVCDVDGDGKPDIVYHDLSTSTVGALHYNPQPAVMAVAPPAITSFSPDTAKNGSNITISGSNFNGSATANTVYLGTAKAKVISATASQLTVQVPTGSTYFPVSVINTSNGLSAASAVPFINTFQSNGIIDTSVFKPNTSPSTGWTPAAPAIGDLDGDGKPDLVYAQSPGNNPTISILPNISTDTGKTFVFKPEIDYLLLSYANDLKLLDFDGDGKLDILVTYYGQQNYSFSVFRNTSSPGNISFAPQLEIPFSAMYLAAGDLNGDGKPDIVAMNSQFNQASLDYRAFVYKNTSVPGKISFGDPVIFGTNGAGPLSITDIDGDAKPDLVVSNTSLNTVTVLRNISANGGFEFAGAVDFTTAAGSSILKTGDLDGDGKPDIVTSDNFKTANISVLRNTSSPGKISFQNHTEFIAGDDIRNITIGDVNGDGKPELLTANLASGNISILQNKSTTGKIAFAAKTDFTPVLGPAYLSLGDLNGDGKPDLAVAYDYSTTSANSYGLTILKNKIKTVPVPTITANGPLAFLQGGSVLLSANPSTGYTYQWAKGGVSIPSATKPTFTATATGAYTVSISLNGETETSDSVKVDAAFKLPADNFKLSVTSATCKGSNNGMVNINAVQLLNYTATITGNGINAAKAFTDTLTFNNLPAGSYSVCITVAGHSDYQQCFDAVVSEPKDLSLYSTVNEAANNVNLVLDGGERYNINLNGVVYTTTNSAITLPLTAGNNVLTVTTDKLCQGTISRIISISGKINPYPVPFQNVLNLNLGNANIGNVTVEIHNTTDGKLVYSKQYNNQSGVIQLDVSALGNGIYALHLSMDKSEKIFKIIKK
ncbi:FG-GAP-like repeat-containing protein [Mucilaginibacter gotjawali]|uniref:Uncharacterized protein n=2 Tax=Mucilaginibacter gotjawali TaxID=1550579 RepID=A0A839SJR8_9SPHI|nr:FG-GAP-like repeat-containing protein [Mucilaginibacter gotjawali]MBB3058581.1 hypothetical protein [Mucilaginibacter gotjawali]BAU52453.1 FG-GAP repeat protein [Mucilaginibacter gotjawali]